MTIHSSRAPKAFSHAVGSVIVSHSNSIRQLRAGKHLVTAKSLAAVGKAILNDEMSIAFIDSDDHCKSGKCADEGFVANQNGEAFLVLNRPGTTDMNLYRALILHEATHATWYLKENDYRINSLLDETLAFVVQATCLHREGISASDIEMLDDPMVSAAYAVARDVIAQGHASATHLHRLRTALLQNNYKNTEKTYKSIK